MRRVKWVLIGGAVLIALISAMALVGVFLPAAHVATRSVRIGQAPDTVWAVVADLPGYPLWWDEVEQVAERPARHGHPVWLLQLRSGPLPLEVTEQRPPLRMLTTIVSDELPFGGTWTYEIVPEGTGARVRVTERGEIYNPLFRFLARFVFGHAGTIESFLSSLSRHFGENGEMLTP